MALCALQIPEDRLLGFRLYLITDRHITDLPLINAVRQALEGGVRAVQVREKDLPVRELLILAAELRRITNDFGAKLFVNDRVDVAVAVEADGVHLGGDSMPAAAVRKVVGGKMLIGVSTHSIDEARQAEADGADFITFGPLFETESKRKYGPPQGLDALRNVKRHIRIPVFGLGGIDRANIPHVLAAGADGVAMISAVLASDNIKDAAEGIIGMIRESLEG